VDRITAECILPKILNHETILHHLHVLKRHVSIEFEKVFLHAVAQGAAWAAVKGSSITNSFSKIIFGDCSNTSCSSSCFLPTFQSHQLNVPSQAEKRKEIGKGAAQRLKAQAARKQAKLKKSHQLKCSSQTEKRKGIGKGAAKRLKTQAARKQAKQKKATR